MTLFILLSLHSYHCFLYFSSSLFPCFSGDYLLLALLFSCPWFLHLFCWLLFLWLSLKINVLQFSLPSPFLFTLYFLLEQSYELLWHRLLLMTSKSVIFYSFDECLSIMSIFLCAFSILMTSNSTYQRVKFINITCQFFTRLIVSGLIDSIICLRQNCESHLWLLCFFLPHSFWYQIRLTVSWNVFSICYILICWCRIFLIQSILQSSPSYVPVLVFPLLFVS